MKFPENRKTERNAFWLGFGGRSFISHFFCWCWGLSFGWFRVLLGSVGAWNLGYSFRRSWCWLWLVGGGVWGHLFIVVLVFGCCLFIIGWGWIGIGCFCILINIISSKPFGLNLLYPRFQSLNLYLSIDWSYLKSSSSSEVVKRKKIPTPLRLFS